MSLYTKTQVIEIENIKAQNDLMNSLLFKHGFFNFYNENLSQYADPESAFIFCNEIYRGLFGQFRYKNFEEFSNVFNGLVSLSILERDFLLSRFKENGFDTWVSFKAIVLHYYPEITEKRLLQFYNNEAIDVQVLLKVGYVKQILG